MVCVCVCVCVRVVGVLEACTSQPIYAYMHVIIEYINDEKVAS